MLWKKIYYVCTYYKVVYVCGVEQCKISFIRQKVYWVYFFCIYLTIELWVLGIL